MDRAILHCDMNNFFASVECMLDKSLKDKPVVVCGDVKERHGIVLAKNYKAKPYGINVGDAVWQAKNKCKDLVVVDTPHYDEYAKYSELARLIYLRYTDRVEPFGMDECWLDVTNSQKLFGDAITIADDIRNTIKKELDLTISVGVSFNKVFAKLGSDLKKPDATNVISRENYKDIVWPLPSSALMGVGRQTKKVLDKYFIYTVGDIANEKRETLEYRLGLSGLMLHDHANGIDNDEVAIYDEIEEVKSVSHGITTTEDLTDYDGVWKVMLELSQEIAYKLRQKKLRAKVVSVSIRDEDLMWCQFQKKLNKSEQSAINIAKEAFELFKKRYDFEKKVRNVTISANMLIEENTPEKISIFDNIEKDAKIEKMERCMETINLKFGEALVKNATLMEDNHIPEKRRKMKYEKDIGENHREDKV